MNPVRYRYEERVLSAEEASQIRQRDIGCLEARVNALRVELSEALEDLETTVGSAPPTTRLVQIELRPGDLGYDEAPSVFDPALYQGSVRWSARPINHERP